MQGRTKPGGWRRSRARGERINMGGAKPSHGRHEAPKHAPALFGDPHTCGPILGETVHLQVLKSEPIQLANVKLAFSDLLQGPFFGRAELDIGSVLHGR